MNYDSATTLSRKIANKEVSCVEVMQHTLEKINNINPVYNAIVSIANQDDLIDQAKMADTALSRGDYWGWMHGFPYAVKDLSNIKGFVTSSGSPLLSANKVDQDSLFANRIRNAGAIFLGKTNVPEFGLGSQSYNTIYGSTKNAFNPRLCAGGSSGGAAVALALDMLPVADGSDMMGSLRNPAAYNNVVGFRPSLGRVPRIEGDVFFSQLSTEGPMGRNVEDVIRLLLTMAGADTRAPLSWRGELGGPEDFTPLSRHSAHVGWLGDFNGHLQTEAGLLTLCEKKLEELTSSGSTVSNCSLGFNMDSLWDSWLTLRHWFLARSPNPLFKNPETRVLLKPEVQWELAQAEEISTKSFALACEVRANWYQTINRAFEQYDFLALPSAQVFPFDVEQHWPTEIEGKSMDTYHRWMEVTIGGTLAGCSVVSLPAGFDKKNRPMGIQFIAPIGEDKKLLEFALAYEEALPWHKDYARITA
jgi:amidase